MSRNYCLPTEIDRRLLKRDQSTSASGEAKLPIRGGCLSAIGLAPPTAVRCAARDVFGSDWRVS